VCGDGYLPHFSEPGGGKVFFAKPGNPETRRLQWLTVELRLARMARPGARAPQWQVIRTASAVPQMRVRGADGAAPPNKSWALSTTAARAIAWPQCAPPMAPTTADPKTILSPRSSAPAPMYRDLASIDQVFSHRRLRWAGRVVRMAWSRLSRKFLSPQVPVVARRRGLTHPEAKGAWPRPRARAPADSLQPGRNGRPASRQAGKQAAHNRGQQVQAADAVMPV
jgi:ribosomal protein L39E